MSFVEIVFCWNVQFRWFLCWCLVSHRGTNKYNLKQKNLQNYFEFLSCLGSVALINMYKLIHWLSAIRHRLIGTPYSHALRFYVQIRYQYKWTFIFRLKFQNNIHDMVVCLHFIATVLYQWLALGSWICRKKRPCYVIGFMFMIS